MNDVCQVTVGFIVDSTVISFGRLRELRELFWVVLPWELTRVNNNTTDSSTMTTNPFGSRMCYNISTVFNWLTEVTTGTKCVVNDNWNTVFVSNCNNFSKSGTLYFGLPMVSK